MISLPARPTSRVTFDQRDGHRLRVAWVHDTARLSGGCEHYMVNTARRLRSLNVESTLLYGESGDGPLDMLSHFDAAFPIVSLADQLAEIQPDVIYAHRISGCEMLNVLASSVCPTIRFFHDHKLFCPREHKYTAVGHQTCTRKIGLGCYACMGVINRSPQWPGIRFRSVGKLRAEQRAHDALAGYVVASNYMAEHLAAHDFRRDKIHVLPLYADCPLEPDQTKRDRRRLLFVGQVVRGKGLDLLLRAMKQLPPAIRLTVAGSGAQLEESVRLAKSLGVDHRVEFVGKKQPNELAWLYRRSGCLVVPSRSPETFGQVGIEAMSHGLPVVGANVGGIGEWLTHNENGLTCRPNHVKSLADALRLFVSSRSMSQRLATGARESFVRRFQAEPHIERLTSLLNQIAKTESKLA